MMREPSPQVAAIVEKLRAAGGDQHTHADRHAAFERLVAISDQIEMFQKVRGIAFNVTAQSTYPAAAIRQIRALYDAFDAKHPPSKEIER